MDARTLSEAMGGSLSMSRYEQLAPAFNTAMQQAGCTTVNRAAMWCAQLGHESAGLRYMRELWGPTPQQLKYDPASGSSLSKTLGNTVVGDGKKYAGAGPIQVTGKGHFASVSRWAHSKGYVPTSTYFVDNPAELSGDRFGFLGAVWYWTVARPDINALSDKGDLDTVTRRINGGTYGLADRRARWDRCRRLGTRLLPTPTAGAPALEEDDMPSAEEVARAVWSWPIEDLYSPQQGDTLPAFGALAWSHAHVVHARQAAQAAMSEVVGLRVAVEKLSGQQGIDPQTIHDAIRQAIAENVHVTGELHVAPRE